MSDDFLFKNRPNPRTEFKDILYSHLVDSEVQQRNNKFTGSVIRYATIVLVLGFGLLLVISQPVRADFLAWIRQIAGFNVYETAESPLSQATGIPLLITEPTVLPLVKIEDAPFDFRTPQYLPDGFSFSPDFAVADSKQWVMMTASNSNDYEITMLVEISNSALVIPAGVDSTSEISINGAQALLIQGGWSSDSIWNKNRGIELQWHQDGLRYDLNYTKRGVNNVVVPFDQAELADRLDELIRMAESIK